MIDEYQDTNNVQKKILSLIFDEMPQKSICAVGDDAQSIYAFRGAEVNNILNFCNEFKDDEGQNAKLFKLEQNYRSTQTIVKAANSLIRHNRNQIPKEVFSENERGEKIQYIPTYSDREEAAVVGKNIQSIKRKELCEYSDFAILYRTNAQSRSFEEELRKQGIPYRIYGGQSFYQRKEIKDIIAYFRLVANPDDEEAFKRIVNYPARGIGATTIGKVTACAHNHQASLWDVIGNHDQYCLDVNKGTQSKLTNFRSLISSFIDRSKTMNVYELGDAIIKESGISEDIMSGKSADDRVRQENLEEFLSGMSNFVDERQQTGLSDEVYLTDYLQDVALLTDADSDGDKDEPRVSLMTVHAAKGLEFPTVFVVGLEENIFPSPMAAVSPRELEEERRLLYVAITRAEKHCILTNAKNRWRYGTMEFDNPSRFIDEIDSSLLDDHEETASSFGGSSKGNGISTGGYGGRMPWDKPGSAFKSVRALNAAQRILNSSTTSPQVSSGAVSASSNSLDGKVSNSLDGKVASSLDGKVSEGMKIEHQRFGVGTILKLEGAGENAKATVEFVNSGTKQLLLKFAKFKVIG